MHTHIPNTLSPPLSFLPLSLIHLALHYTHQVSGYEDILIETMNLCCQYFEQHMYMVPKEKYMLLKVRQ